MIVSQKTIASPLEELGTELGISEADFGGKVKVEGKDRFSGESNDASKLDWSVFSGAVPEKRGDKQLRRERGIN